MDPRTWSLIMPDGWSWPIAAAHRLGALLTPHSLHAAAPLKPLPEPVDLEQYRVRRHARAGGLINEYRLIA